MRRISCETFLELSCLSDIAVSPDGRYAAYTARTPELSGNGYPAELRLICIEDGSDRRLGGDRDRRAHTAGWTGAPSSIPLQARSVPTTWPCP